VTQPLLHPTRLGVLHEECEQESVLLPLYLFIGGFTVVLYPVLVYALWNVRDAYGIRKELLLSTGIWALTMVGYILIGNVIGKRGIHYYISPRDFIVISMTICYFISIGIPVIMLLWQRRRHRFSDLEQQHRRRDTREGFVRSLADPLYFNDFKNFAVKDFSIENALFYDRCMRLKLMRGAKLAAAQQEIYNLFLAPDAYFQVNVSDRALKKLRDAVDSSGWDQPGLLDELSNEIVHLMYNDTYPRYLAHQEHK